MNGDDSQPDTTEQPKEPILVDAGTVIMMVGTPEGGFVPMPLPAVFQQVFGILGDLDARLMKIEGAKEESRIITLD